MCEPATLAAMGTWAASNAATIAAVSAVAGTGLGIYSQNETAKAQNEAINKAQVDSYAQLSRQGVEDAQNNTLEVNKLNREMTSRVASARVAAAGAGVGGLSVDAMLLDLSGKGLEAATTAETNYARTQAARGDQAASLTSGFNGQRSQVRNVGAADYLAAGLKITDAGVKYAKATYP